MMNTDIYLEIKKKINEADAIVIGAGSGLSTAAGINYGTKDFASNPVFVCHDILLLIFYTCLQLVPHNHHLTIFLISH